LIFAIPDTFRVRTTGVSLAVAAALIGTVAVTTAGAPAAARAEGRYDFCPAAIPLVDAHTKWQHHVLAPGVRLAETYVRGGRGWINIDVLRADLTDRRVAVAPLHRSLTSRRLLTSLAARRQLVAATNGMYFNLGYGSPKVPFLEHGKPLVMSATPEHVAGIGSDGRAEDGDIWLTGDVHSEGLSYPLGAMNEVAVPQGLTLYTRAWGHHRIPMPAGAKARAIVGNRLASHPRRQRWLPQGGLLLVARGSDALRWLAGLPMDAPITVSRRVATDAPVPFRQAYGVGTQTVANPGEVLDGLYCRASERYAARTAIAWKRGGRTLMLVAVESPRGPDHYGLDENQMSGLLVSLGAARAFALDGGGSTALVARLKLHVTRHVKRHVRGRIVRRVVHKTVRRLVLRVHPRGSVGREIPVGLGIYSRPAG
jgi:hypothetical protein